MAKGLFAKEDDGSLGLTESGDEVVTEELGEVSDVSAEVTTDVAGIDEAGAEIEDGITAADQVEGVEGMLEEAVESGEELSPVAVESIRFALATICRPMGADASAVMSEFAAESYSPHDKAWASPAFALEGVQEFAKDLYKRIKAALERLWKKMKAFWDKHISNLGRVKKALDNMKSKVKSSTGKLKGSPFVEKAPSGLVSLFTPADTLDIGTVESKIDAQITFNEQLGKWVEKQKPATIIDAGHYPGVIRVSLAGSKMGDKIEVASGKNLLGGEDVTVEIDTDENDGRYSFELRVERDASDYSVDKDVGANIPTKEKLVALLSKVSDEVKDAVTGRKKFDKTQDEINKALQVLGNKTEERVSVIKNDTYANNIRSSLNVVYKLSVFNSKFAAMAISDVVKMARATLAYSAFVLKQYK